MICEPRENRAYFPQDGKGRMRLLLPLQEGKPVRIRYGPAAVSRVRRPQYATVRQRGWEGAGAG